MTTDLRATGLQSFSPVVLVFFGMGMMVERLKHEGTLHSSSDLLEICVKMGVSWSAQDFRQTGVTQSGTGSFILFCFRKTWRTSSSLIWSAGVGVREELEVLMVVWSGAQGRCGVFFQTWSRTHSDRLPVADSPQCWGMVSCSWWSLSDLSTLMQNHWKRMWSLAYCNNSSLLFWSPFPVCI